MKQPREKGWYAELSEEKKEMYRAIARRTYRKHHAKNLEKQRAKRNKDREAWNAKAREYMRKNRDNYYEYNAANRFKVKRAEIQALCATSAVCEICGNPPKAKTRLGIDHDHGTGKLRGMLCRTCNLGLGAFKDNEILLHKAFFYLMKHKKVAVVA